MTDHDKPAFVALLTDVLAFYGQSVSPFAVSVWWEACKGFDMPAIRAAMTAHATDPDRGHFAPKPADVIRVVRGSASDAAVSAWHDLLDQVRSVGSYGSPRLTDVQRAALDGIGGWMALCRSEEAELGFIQKRFVDGYVIKVEREQRAALPGAQVLRIA